MIQLNARKKVVVLAAALLPFFASLPSAAHAQDCGNNGAGFDTWLGRLKAKAVAQEQQIADLKTRLAASEDALVTERNVGDNARADAARLDAEIAGARAALAAAAAAATQARQDRTQLLELLKGEKPSHK